MSVGDRQAGGAQFANAAGPGLSAQPYQDYHKAKKVYSSCPRYKHAEPCPQIISRLASEGVQAAALLPFGGSSQRWSSTPALAPCPLCGTDPWGKVPFLCCRDRLWKLDTASSSTAFTSLLTSFGARLVIATNWVWASCWVQLLGYSLCDLPASDGATMGLRGFICWTGHEPYLVAFIQGWLGVG